MKLHGESQQDLISFDDDSPLHSSLLAGEAIEMYTIKRGCHFLNQETTWQAQVYGSSRLQILVRTGAQSGQILVVSENTFHLNKQFFGEIPPTQCYDWCLAPPHEPHGYRCVSPLQLRSRNCKSSILVLLKGKAILESCISVTQSFSSRPPCPRARACFHCQPLSFTSKVLLSHCCLHAWLCFVGYLEMLFGGCF